MSESLNCSVRQNGIFLGNVSAGGPTPSYSNGAIIFLLPEDTSNYNQIQVVFVADDAPVPEVEAADGQIVAYFKYALLEQMIQVVQSSPCVSFDARGFSLYSTTLLK